MSRKDSQVPVDEETRLHAAVTRVEAEMALTKERLQREPAPPKTKPGAGAGKQAQYTDQSAGAITGKVDVIIDLLDRTLSRLKWGAAVVIITVVLTGLGVGLNSCRNTGLVIQQIQLNHLEITTPRDGASVSEGQLVRGNSPFTNLNHYLVLTQVRTGSLSIQPAHVNTDGTFSGETKFTDAAGNSTAGEDEEFTIRVLATQEQLGSGGITSLPVDAKISVSVTVKQTKAGEQFAITLPTAGAMVGFDDVVSGTSPFNNLNHYLFVTPLRGGTRYVQDQPATLSNGTFSGRAKFGGANSVGEQFSVQVVATKSTLAAGPIVTQPEDAVLSNTVTVRRK